MCRRVCGNRAWRRRQAGLHLTLIAEGFSRGPPGAVDHLQPEGQVVSGRLVRIHAQREILRCQLFPCLIVAVSDKQLNAVRPRQRRCIWIPRNLPARASGLDREADGTPLLRDRCHRRYGRRRMMHLLQDEIQDAANQQERAGERDGRSPF